MLVIGKGLLDRILAHCLDAYPLEGCGLLGGVQDGRVPGSRRARVTSCHPVDNIAHSARVYEVDPRGMLLADRAIEAAGDELLGVYHSHTHTDAKPSPTDVDQAPDPDWHYVIVSTRDVHPSIRSWRIVGGKTEEEPVVLEW